MPPNPVDTFERQDINHVDTNHVIFNDDACAPFGHLQLPVQWATLVRGYKFHFELRRLKKDLSVTHGMSITEDQQGLKFVPCGSYTMEYTGAKEVRIAGGTGLYEGDADGGSALVASLLPSSQGVRGKSHCRVPM